LVKAHQPSASPSSNGHPMPGASIGQKYALRIRHHYV